jgi:hypothetical protein
MPPCRACPIWLEACLPHNCAPPTRKLKKIRSLRLRSSFFYAFAGPSGTAKVEDRDETRQR